MYFLPLFRSSEYLQFNLKHVLKYLLFFKIMDIYHWITDTLNCLFKIHCMLGDSHLTDFALWHLPWILSTPLGLQVGTVQLVTGDQRCLKKYSMLFLLEWEVFQQKAIKVKSCFYLWVLLIYSSLTGKLNFNFQWIFTEQNIVKLLLKVEALSSSSDLVFLHT